MFGQAKITHVLLACLIFICSCCDNADQNTLNVTLGDPVRYGSADGQIFKARYGSLSDNSLHFVKVTMPDGREYTLPQVISASGVRYTDERSLVWWTQKGTVRVEVRDTNGEWMTKYSSLREITTE